MKIFIQIASYRDPELLFTIKDCINNANKPNNLVFAIAADVGVTLIVILTSLNLMKFENKIAIAQ